MCGLWYLLESVCVLPSEHWKEQIKHQKERTGSQATMEWGGCIIRKKLKQAFAPEICKWRDTPWATEVGERLGLAPHGFKQRHVKGKAS